MSLQQAGAVCDGFTAALRIEFIAQPAVLINATPPQELQSRGILLLLRKKLEILRLPFPKNANVVQEPAPSRPDVARLLLLWHWPAEREPGFNQFGVTTQHNLAEKIIPPNLAISKMALYLMQGQRYSVNAVVPVASCFRAQPPPSNLVAISQTSPTLGTATLIPSPATSAPQPINPANSLQPPATDTWLPSADGHAYLGNRRRRHRDISPQSGDTASHPRRRSPPFQDRIPSFKNANGAASRGVALPISRSATAPQAAPLPSPSPASTLRGQPGAYRALPNIQNANSVPSSATSKPVDPPVASTSALRVEDIPRSDPRLNNIAKPPPPNKPTPSGITHAPRSTDPCVPTPPAGSRAIHARPSVTPSATPTPRPTAPLSSADRLLAAKLLPPSQPMSGSVAIPVPRISQPTISVSVPRARPSLPTKPGLHFTPGSPSVQKALASGTRQPSVNTGTVVIANYSQAPISSSAPVPTRVPTLNVPAPMGATTAKVPPATTVPQTPEKAPPSTPAPTENTSTQTALAVSSVPTNAAVASSNVGIAVHQAAPSIPPAPKRAAVKPSQPTTWQIRALAAEKKFEALKSKLAASEAEKPQNAALKEQIKMTKEAAAAAEAKTLQLQSVLDTVNAQAEVNKKAIEDLRTAVKGYKERHRKVLSNVFATRLKVKDTPLSNDGEDKFSPGTLTSALADIITEVKGLRLRLTTEESARKTADADPQKALEGQQDLRKSLEGAVRTHDVAVEQQAKIVRVGHEAFRKVLSEHELLNLKWEDGEGRPDFLAALQALETYHKDRGMQLQILFDGKTAELEGKVAYQAQSIRASEYALQTAVNPLKLVDRAWKDEQGRLNVPAGIRALDTYYHAKFKDLRLNYEETGVQVQKRLYALQEKTEAKQAEIEGKATQQAQIISGTKRALRDLLLAHNVPFKSQEEADDFDFAAGLRCLDNHIHGLRSEGERALLDAHSRLREEQKRRANMIQLIEKECREPFVVPALLEAFMSMSAMSDDVMK